MAQKKSQPSASGFLEVSNKALDSVQHKAEKNKAEKKAKPAPVAEVEPVVEVAPEVEATPVVEEAVSEESASEPTE